MNIEETDSDAEDENGPSTMTTLFKYGCLVIALLCNSNYVMLKSLYDHGNDTRLEPLVYNVWRLGFIAF